MSSPRAGANPSPLSAIRIGIADAHSGIRAGSLSVTADFAVAGRQPGAELADLARQAGDGIYEIPLVPQSLQRATVRVRVSDVQGNVTRVERVFSVP